MNMFTNSIINIIYTLFNSIMPEYVKVLFVIVSASTYFVGMIFSFFHYKQRFRYPLLYTIPVVRIFAILFEDDDYTEIKRAQNICFCSIVFAIACLYISTLGEEGSIIMSAFALISIVITTISGAYLNYHLLCEADGIKKSKRHLIFGILLYFFPFLYMYFTLPKEYKGKNLYSKFASVLAFIVFVEAALVIPPIEVRAEEYHVETNCSICNNSESRMMYKVVFYSYENDTSTYKNYIGVTCNDCEIIHILNTDSDWGFAFDGDGSVVNNDLQRSAGFVDFSCIDSSYTSYVPYCFDKDLTSGVLVFMFQDGYEPECSNFYYNGVHEIFNNTKLNCIPYKLIPSGENIYATLKNLDYAIDQDAKECKPKNINFKVSNVIDNNQNGAYTSDKGNNVNTQIETEEKISITNVLKDVDWGQTAKDSLVKSLGAVGVGIGLAALASLSPVIATGIGILGAVSAITYTASTITRAINIAKNDDLSIEDKEYAWAGFTSDVLSDGVAITAGLVAYSYFKPQFTNALVKNQLLSPNTLTELESHLMEGKFDSNKGIIGGHEKSDFIQICDDNNLLILNEKPMNIKGVSAIEYKIPRKDGSGLYKSTSATKTVFDSSIISKEEFMNYGLEAIDNYIASNSGKIIEGKNSSFDSNGVTWEFYIRDGKVKTIYPLN
ncbi:MAG: CdiA family toxin C-terminal domain-containing protein [Bacteroidales bacterium]|nr:CdiA family toxin C-terminal domain-containing protein [Bacteroidales bacterium]